MADPHSVAAGRKMKRKPVVHSRVVQVRVKDVLGDSLTILSSKSVSGEIPLVLVPTPRNPLSMMMCVPKGVDCLVQKFGKDIGIFEPGLHMVPAYYRIAYVVSKQSCCYDAPVFKCPTADDVRVSVDVVLVFSVTDSSKFIYRLGARNFDEFLSGTVDEAIRVMVRKETHTTVYGLRGDKDRAPMLNMLNDKFIEAGVTFTDVKIVGVWLPDQLANALEITTKMKEGMTKLSTAARFEELQIRQQSEMEIEEISRRQEQVLVQEKGRKRRAEIEFENRSVKAEEEGSVALIKSKGKVEVDMLNSQTELDRTKQKLETIRLTQVAAAEAAANTKKIAADFAEEEEVIKASWQEEKMKCEATITKSTAGIEASSTKNLAAKREHEMMIREKTILSKLAASGRFNLIGSPGDKIVNAVLKGSFHQEA